MAHAQLKLTIINYTSEPPRGVSTQYTEHTHLSPAHSSHEPENCGGKTLRLEHHIHVEDVQHHIRVEDVGRHVHVEDVGHHIHVEEDVAQTTGLVLRNVWKQCLILSIADSCLFNSSCLCHYSNSALDSFYFILQFVSSLLSLILPFSSQLSLSVQDSLYITSCCPR